jgi:hypothetical protein
VLSLWCCDHDLLATAVEAEFREVGGQFDAGPPS